MGCSTVRMDGCSCPWVDGLLDCEDGWMAAKVHGLMVCLNVEG